MDAIFKALRTSLLFVTLLSGCAYHLGNKNRSIPGGYKQVSVPIFKNHTQETGIEVSFTNALIEEFQRSRVARVVDNSLSEVTVVGQIDDLQYIAPIVVGSDIIRLEQDDLVVALQGRFILLEGQERVASIVVRFRKVRLEQDGLV